MTKQNKIHKYIRECEQLRKVGIRNNKRAANSKKYKHHTGECTVDEFLEFIEKFRKY